MKITLDLKNYDKAESVYKRTAARAIIKKDSKYLLIFSKYNDYKFPGGGVEAGEDLKEALIREIKEETGYSAIKDTIDYYGETFERRKGETTDVMEMFSHYFYCQVDDGVGVQNLDDYEEEYGYQVVWMTLEEAIEKNRQVTDLDACPWVIRDMKVMEILLNEEMMSNLPPDMLRESMMIKLETPRTIIRDHSMEDLESHHQLFSDKKTMYYLQDISTDSLEESKANLEAAVNAINEPERKFYFLRIEEKGTNKHIGEIGYTVNEVTPFGKLVGMGYFIRPEYWGQGYTSEALREVIRFAFQEKGVFRISCGCIKENAGSEKVMIKCGLKKEAEFKSFVWHDGRMKDRVEYRLLKSEWEKMQ